ncbi:peptidase domain-containing ABC transporter [Acaryochloris sp. 'Moss Beach']|uniref:peptidase domain-containing ABC transporter n=1 Tax=Acaryochloris TaxID=155977 RepID=UPI001BAFE35B|nr:MULTISPECIES: peptidase domain-containing ABC transporter [Acaryochloris]QUY42678.1 peptidase domain-containing ABC transporter [Acaryochloris marina S15]UJB71758.1 peptidase domain-containing ABC transporter [Acaryochloris sp. 'Moss Beach']
MTSAILALESFLKDLPGFNQLSEAVLSSVAKEFQPLRYPMGRPLVSNRAMPQDFTLIYQGQVRLLGYDPRTDTPVTLSLLGPGAAVGWISLVRQIPCETAIASVETVGLKLPAATFLELLEHESSLAQVYEQQANILEAFDVLGQQLLIRADGSTDLKFLAERALPASLIQKCPIRDISIDQLQPNLEWFVSGGSIPDLEIGQPLETCLEQLNGTVSRSETLRLIGLSPIKAQQLSIEPVASIPQADTWEDIPEAPTLLPAVDDAPVKHGKYPFKSGRGPIDAPLACFQMLALYLNLPFRKDVLRRILKNQAERNGPGISLPVYGAISESMGLRAQLVETPASAFSRLPAPALINWQDRIALVYETSAKEIVFAVPEQTLLRQHPDEFLEAFDDKVQVLLLERTHDTPQSRFNLSWFWPSIKKHRKVLIEVLIASFFVQLFGLANPLITQVIIDKVLSQGALGTLNVLGMLLVGVAVFEALLTSFRTYLFVDTTNRIDMSLGAEVIDHLVRLPLRYFDKRPVGELATRVNELENIRKFLTGTALTVVLDAVFSVVYIVVMVFYSWLLTIIALGTVPLFALLTFIFAPIIRRLARTKAEENAKTQSYLVEVVSGIQTVKAQNIELKSRWQWQDRYARYVSAGFKAVVASTTAGSMSGFLNKLSSLLLLWVGAYLFIEGQLTVGELIAFRIIAGYTTGPLLRLVQLWQNFQETALSLERLSDILDYPQEVTEADRDLIPMPLMEGAVKFEDLSFRFKDSGPMQLQQVSLEVPAQTFVGIVGQSGSGKSTLMKLLMRLYNANGGRIVVDQYDISKVELYSLRRQIGMVLQDSLLFDGTVQENIALSAPDATAEEIVEAARIAYAHDFIMELPQGYNSRVGERGSSLSGGQRQRIAIARMVLQNPQLIILDEATSALDYNAERQVCLNLAEAFGDRTVFFVTHRLKTLESADMILMMDQGNLVEQGTHAELMQQKGRYYWLYQQQETQS